MVGGKGKRVVLVTCGSLKEARKIARGVVSARLAACVNIGTAGVESIYRWKGKVEAGARVPARHQDDGGATGRVGRRGEAVAQL